MKKKYDQARTPYRRVLESPSISQQAKEKLKQEYDKLNPVQLQREITRMQDALSKLVLAKRESSKEVKQDTKTLEYIFK